MKPYLKYFFIAALLLTVFLFGRQCNAPVPVKTNIDSLKTTIRSELKERPILKSIAAEKVDSAIKWRDRWHTAKTLTVTLPCDTVLKIVERVADSVIVVDSSAIVAQARVIALDDSLLCNYRQVVINDSMTILGLQKEIKRQKRQKRLIAFASVLVGGAIITR